jgi:hypothetical protein
MSDLHKTSPTDRWRPGFSLQAISATLMKVTIHLVDHSPILLPPRQAREFTLAVKYACVRPLRTELLHLPP